MDTSKLTWVKNTQNNSWFDLLRLNLDSPYFAKKKGVYAIWYAAPNTAKVIKIGGGNISEVLKYQKTNPEILKFSSFGGLKVSWLLFEDKTVGIEKFLAKSYSPILSERYPENEPEVPIPLIN